MNGRRTALVAVGLVVGIAGAATIAGAGVPAKNGRIAFARLGLGTGVQASEIFATNGDGSGEQRVTQPPAGYKDDLPSWSPDGSRITFQRCASTGGACLVWSVNADGSGPERLSPACQTPGACADDRSPVYSPDGRHIAFVRTTGKTRLMVAGSKLGHARALAGLASFGGSPYSVAWSPNAGQLVFASVGSDGRRAVYVAAANGTHPKRVTPWTLEAGGRPDWSPNGKRILFRSYSNRLGGFGVNLYTVRPDGTGLVQLTHFPSSDRVFAGPYSPDGAHVVLATSADDRRARHRRDAHRRDGRETGDANRELGDLARLGTATVNRRLPRTLRGARHYVVFAALVVALGGPGADSALAHAGLIVADPLPGAGLGATPTAIRLTFSENAQASLSSIRVVDDNGRAHQVGKVTTVAGDPHSVAVRLQQLGRGVYTVTWRVVSAVDGHATAGAYAFGVGVVPTGPTVTTGSTSPVASRLEMVARWVMLIGLVALLGAGVASVARFGSASGDLLLGTCGWLAAAVGLVLLAEAQRRIADTSFDALVRTPVGHALAWRALAIGAAGAALLLARRAYGWRRRAAMAGAALASFAAMVVHIAAGHAASGAWPEWLSVALQSAHFAAAGIWIGGLAALLLGLRGAPSTRKVVAVRRFAVAAATGFIVIAATGTARAVEELTTWRDLTSTGYGRAVLAKIALLLAIGVVAARNRLRSVPAAAQNLRPLRRLSGVELVLATARARCGRPARKPRAACCGTPRRAAGDHRDGRACSTSAGRGS